MSPRLVSQICFVVVVACGTTTDPDPSVDDTAAADADDTATGDDGGSGSGSGCGGSGSGDEGSGDEGSGDGGSGSGSGSGGDTDPATEPELLFSSDVTTVVLEVDYEGGAEPYTGSTLLSSDLWDLFGANADALFDGSKTLDYPSQLADMEEVTGLDGGPYTTGDIRDIAATWRDRESSSDTAAYYVVFLDGYYEDGAGDTRTGVLGVSLTGTSLIAMFKPVIESSTSLATVREFVEQTTLVHEFGHAVGLVNNGVPLQSEHHDEEHGAHCSNDDCVMYWSVEGASDVADFASQYVTSGSSVLFGDDCLDDVAAISAR